MPLTFPQVSVGKPVNHKSLTVFPLFHRNGSPIDYQLSNEAITAQAVVVQEIGEQGSVPNLIVDNTGETRVLFLEGEELRGAKQNRILNTTVMVSAHSKTKIPVSCVERGRWRYTSKQFCSGMTGSPSKLRHALKGSVTQSLKQQQGHRSDQGAVWAEVDKLTACFGTSSPTAAMADTYKNLNDKMDDYREKMKYPEGASGVAIVLGSKVVCLDVFDKPGTCEKAWDRLLSGCLLDAMRIESEGTVEAQAVEDFVLESGKMAWEEAETVGEGQEYRAEINGSIGSALVVDGAVIHLNVMRGE